MYTWLIENIKQQAARGRRTRSRAPRSRSTNIRNWNSERQPALHALARHGHDDRPRRRPRQRETLLGWPTARRATPSVSVAGLPVQDDPNRAARRDPARRLRPGHRRQPRQLTTTSGRLMVHQHRPRWLGQRRLRQHADRQHRRDDTNSVNGVTANLTTCWPRRRGLDRARAATRTTRSRRRPQDYVLDLTPYLAGPAGLHQRRAATSPSASTRTATSSTTASASRSTRTPAPS